jgi:hypothetical protein
MLRSDRNPAGAAMDKEEPAQEERIVPVVEEELVAGRRPVKTGSVRLEKHVEKSRKRVEAPLIREEVEVRHVPVNRVITTMPETRREGVIFAKGQEPDSAAAVDIRVGPDMGVGIAAALIALALAAAMFAAVVRAAGRCAPVQALSQNSEPTKGSNG